MLLEGSISFASQLKCDVYRTCTKYTTNYVVYVSFLAWGNRQEPKSMNINE